MISLSGEEKRMWVRVREKVLQRLVEKKLMKQSKASGYSLCKALRKDKSVEQDDDDGSCCSGVKDDSGNSVTPLIDLDKVTRH